MNIQYPPVDFRLAPKHLRNSSVRLIRIWPSGFSKPVSEIALDHALSNIVPAAHPARVHRIRKHKSMPATPALMKRFAIASPVKPVEAKLTWIAFLARYASNCYHAHDLVTTSIVDAIIGSIGKCRADGSPLPFPERPPRNIIDGCGQLQLALLDVPAEQRTAQYAACWKAALALRDRLDSK